ncbi:hypothetical protein EIZ39_24145 [Ammoniphilus sp. CFH 90114]|nr:hypothetical protein EIZ39_24145 [Ammoniphilus sp. CFH 90114]
MLPAVEQNGVRPRITSGFGRLTPIDLRGSYGGHRFVYVDKRITKPNISVQIFDSSLREALKEQSKDKN